MLGLNGEKAEGGEDSGQGSVTPKSEISNPQSPPPTPPVQPSAVSRQPSSPSLAPRPWCVGVLVEGEAYLFDPLLGLPIPAPNGVTRDESGQLAIQPATLAQVANDGKLLRRLDADESTRTA